ncbi:MAG: PqqD family protein [Acidobacteriota bacterium]
MRRLLPNRNDVIFEDFGDEIVLVNLKNGNYYSINKTGRVIWELLSNGSFSGQISAALSGRYPGEKDMEKNVDAFIADLESEGLLISSGIVKTESGNISEPELNELFRDGEKFPGDPVMEKYTDQQEILLLDPIHEVSGLGWPEKSGNDPDHE